MVSGGAPGANGAAGPSANGTSGASGTRPPSLRIVAVNDVYLLDNLPKLKTLVDAEASRDPADLLLVTLAGDFLSPSLLSSLDHGRGMVDVLNGVPVTHVCFGNHEDDLHVDEVRKRVTEFRGCWLNTNMPSFVPALPKCQIVEVGNPGGRKVRVGMVGVVMDDRQIYAAPPFGGTEMLGANESAIAVAKKLIEDEGCACVVPLTHQDLEDDLLLARWQGERTLFPVILGGHEHQPMEEKVGRTLLVKAGTDAETAVVIDLTWPAEAPAPGQPDLPHVATRNVDVTALPPDPALQARAEQHMKLVAALERATLLFLGPGEELSSVGTRRQQTSFGTVICNRLRDVMGADMCMVNGGGIRANQTYEAKFTFGNLRAEYPFPNMVVVVRMPGSVVRDAILHTRSKGETGSFLQVDDGVVVDESHRLVSVAGQPFDEKKVLRVALIQRFLEGMDNIEPIVEFANANPHMVPRKDAGRDVKEVLVEGFARSLWGQLGTFEAMDADGDQKLDASEIAAAVERRAREPASEITVELLIRALDKNDDHMVDKQEGRGTVKGL
ncbi:Metallo-dependent phosphatase-like protein [Hyaloraphidium curvatum]|nr:Metallo-dependent phosphatase-like protein [Hyaloraphidium curvatum]